MEKTTSLNRQSLWFIVACVLALVIAIVLWQINNTACAIVILELPNLLAIFLTGLVIGYLPVKFLTVDSGLTKSQVLILATATGTGILSLIVLMTGLAGLLHLRWFWLAFVWLFGFIGAIVVYVNFKSSYASDSNLPNEGRVVFESGGWWTILLILAIPFVILTLLCVTIPPGVLWSAEGAGYDVLEYHLQIPKEWFLAGRIFHLSNNVYSNFPFNAELLYLLAMILKNSPYEAVYLAQMIHFTFAILFVAVVWIFTRNLGLKGAAVATSAAATCSWIMYLSPLAYNEMGMIFFGAAATGLIIHCWYERHKTSSKTFGYKYAFLIGLLLGISSGFKYTSVAMIFVPIVFAFFVLSLFETKFHRALLATLIVIAGWLSMFCPYLIRNYFWTGNPVFPLAYKYFDGSDFDQALAHRWEQGHSAKLPGIKQPEKSFNDKLYNVVPRLKQLYWAGFRNIIIDNIIAETYRTKGKFKQARNIINPPPILDLPKFGLAILILPWLIFFSRRQKLIDWLLLLIFLFQTFVWLFFTHLQARFLIVWLSILPFLIARSAEKPTKSLSSLNIFILAVLIISSAVNFNDCLRRYKLHCYTETGEPINWFGQHRAFLKGMVPGYEQLKIINATPSATTMLIADARPFYYRGKTIYWTVFNRNDFAQAAAGPLHQLKNYIASVHPNFIFVNWAEAYRLKHTYGFEKSIKPKLFYYLSSPPRFKVKRVKYWKPIIRFDGRPTPARVLYKIIYPKLHKGKARSDTSPPRRRVRPLIKKRRVRPHK